MKKEVKIGIYAIVILLCAWAGIRFLSGVDVFGRHAVYYARYEQVNGVQNAAAVMIRGVKIGKVSEIRVSPGRPDERRSRTVDSAFVSAAGRFRG